MRLLFVNRGGLGNCLMMAPAIRWAHWRWPDAYIAAALETTSIPALATNPDVNAAYGIDHAVADGAWDVVFCPPPSPRGWDHWLAQLQVGQVVARPDSDCDRMHEAQIALEMVGWQEGDEKPPMTYAVPPGQDAAAKDLVDWNAPKRPRVAFAFGYVAYPGPGEAKNRKHWPLAYFKRLAWRVWREYHASIIWLGSSWEAVWSPRLRKPPSWAPMAVPWSVTAGILRRCDLLICADNGVMHLANAVGTRIVTIFGSSPTVKVAPWNGNAEIMRLDMPCSPCYRCNSGFLPCEYGQWCMKGLTPDMVWPAVQRALG